MKPMSEKEFFRLVPKTGWKLNKSGEMTEIKEESN